MTGRLPLWEGQEAADGGTFERLASMVVPRGADPPLVRPSRPPPLRKPTVELYCPFEWGLNPYVEIVQTASVGWAERVGLVQSDTQRSQLARSKIGWLESLVFHSARLDVLQLATDWTTLFCLLDDYVETYQRDRKSVV